MAFSGPSGAENTVVPSRTVDAVTVGVDSGCDLHGGVRTGGLGLYWSGVLGLRDSLAGVQSRVERPVSRWFESCGREHRDRHARSRMECG
jgi:hypothetical protein